MKRGVDARFVEAHERGDAEAIRELITEDATWHLPPSAGVGWFTGAAQVSAALAGGAADNWLDVSTIKRKVTGIVVDGDTAVALESKTAMTYGGEYYANDYCWVCTFGDGMTWKVRNCTDTLHADRLFGLDNKTPPHRDPRALAVIGRRPPGRPPRSVRP
jgi:ketosteroid isomerase-like protein